MANRFQGKVALITGGASGIGKTTAQVFAREGAKVVLCADLNIRGGEETVRSIKEAGGEASFFKCDVSKEEDVEKLVEKCVRTYGRLDYAFNNAGIGPDGKRIPVLTIVDTTEEIWDRTIDVNLKGIWLCMKYEIKQMLKQKFGAIVNTSSVGGWKAKAGFGAYTASKHGLIGLTKTAALECAGSNIRVNAILPGFTQGTQLSDNLLTVEPERKERASVDIPLQRVGDPEDAAEAVLWLCSDAASFITGVSMPIDGGVTLT